MDPNLPLRSPHHVILNLTTHCNLACLHCFGNYGSGTDLKLDQWKRVIDDLVKNEVFYVNLTGGEPTQYPYFKEFIEYLSEKKMFFSLTTNGVFSDDIMDILRSNKKYIINIKISLDGPDSESHGFLRKKAHTPSDELFNIPLKNIKTFNLMDTPVSISTVLHSKNINKLNKFYDLFSKIKVDTWLISPITFVGRAEKNKVLLKYKRELKDLIGDILIPLSRRLIKKGVSLELVDFPLNQSYKNFYFICGAARSFCEINSDGIVSPCALSRIVLDKKTLNFDNITKTPLNEIWNGKAFIKFRRWQDRGCGGCQNSQKCKRCVPQSFLYFNDYSTPPPFCISIGDELGLSNIKNLKISEGYKKWKQR